MGNYSRGDEASLPSGVADLETLYDGTDLAAVETAGDSQFATQTATDPQIPIHQYKDTVTAPTVDLTWTGQSDQDCADYPVTLQVYKFSTTTWEDLSTNNTTTANNNFTLQKLGQASSGYVDGSNVLTSRVYQKAAATEPTVMDSYDVTQTGNTFLNQTDQNQGLGVVFVGDGNDVTSIKFKMRDYSLAGNLYFRVYDLTSQTDNVGVPTGSPLATSAAITPSSLGTTFAFYEASMITPCATSNGTRYAAVVEYEGTDNSNYAGVGLDNAGSLPDDYLIKKSTTWTNNGHGSLETLFYVYGTP